MTCALLLAALAPLPAARADEGAFVDEVWQELAAVPHGATADAVAAEARKTAPSVVIADAEVTSTVARNRQTLSRYVPRLIAQGSYQRRNRVAFDFGGGGASVGAANEGVLQVGACPGGGSNCVVDVTGIPVTAVVAPGFVIPRDVYTVQADLSIPFSDYVLALSPARRAAEADEASAKFRKQAELATVDVNARIAYYDWLRAKAQVALARRSLASAEARLADARTGLEAGTLTSADALGVESLVASSRAAMAQAESFLRLTEQNLKITAQWQGSLDVGEDLSQPPPNVASLGPLASLIDSAQQARAEARALRAAITATGFAQDGVLANMLPRLDGIANVTHANPNQIFFPPTPVWRTSWFFGLALRWQVDQFLQARAQGQELDATARSLRAQQTQIARAIELEVRAAWEEWQRAAEAARLADAEIRAAVALHEQRLLLFRGGEATSTEIQEAEVQRHNATLRLLTAQIDQRIAHARLRRAAGVLPEEADAR